MNDKAENSGNKPEDILLDLTKLTTAPAPFSTEGIGEFWSWSNYFMTFQRNPKTMIEAMYEIQGKDAPDVPLKYHYALSVYYHLDKNPYGPSQRPLLIYTLEQADLSIFKNLMSAGDSFNEKELQSVGNYTSMLCKFENGAHLNLGDYDGSINDREVRDNFFSMMKNDLQLQGSPVHHGTLSDAWGHEKSGMPARKKKSAGCLSILMSFILLIGLLSFFVWV